MTGNDHCCSKLFTNFTLEENLPENQRKIYISGIVYAIKSKVLIIHVDAYTVHCTVSNRL